MMTMFMAVLLMTVFYVACSLIQPHKLPADLPEGATWIFQIDPLDVVYFGMCIFIILTTRG